MRDTLRRYRARREAFTPCEPGPPSGTVARHVRPLAARLSGIVGSPSTPLPHSAAQVPTGPHPASRVKRFARWGDTPHLLEAVDFLPSADVLLRPLALPTLGRVLEGSGGGRGGTALLIPVVDTGRALPRAWRGRPAPQGHFPAALPLAVVALSSGLRPAGTQGGGWARGPARGRGSSSRSSRWAGPPRAARPRAPWRRGRARPSAWRRSARVASRAGGARERRAPPHARHMVSSWGCVVGPRGSTSRGRWSALGRQQRKPVAGRKRACASRPGAQTRQVAGSICIRRLGPMGSAGHGSS